MGLGGGKKRGTVEFSLKLLVRSSCSSSPWQCLLPVPLRSPAWGPGLQAELLCEMEDEALWASRISTMLGPVMSPRQVLFQPQSSELRCQQSELSFSRCSSETGCEAGSSVYTESLRYCPGAHSSSLGNPKAQVAGCPWLLRPFLFSEHSGGCCHGHSAVTSFCPQVMVLNTASTPRGPCSGFEGTALFSDPETTRNRMAVISPSA